MPKRSRIAAWFGRWRAAALLKRREAAARAGHYFWSPCPLCGEYFGGNEWDADDAFELGPMPRSGGGGSGASGVCAKCGPLARSMTVRAGRRLYERDHGRIEWPDA